MSRENVSAQEMADGLVETFLIKKQTIAHLAILSAIECCDVMIKELEHVEIVGYDVAERIKFWREVKDNLEKRVS